MAVKYKFTEDQATTFLATILILLAGPEKTGEQCPSDAQVAAMLADYNGPVVAEDAATIAREKRRDEAREEARNLFLSGNLALALALAGLKNPADWSAAIPHYLVCKMDDGGKGWLDAWGSLASWTRWAANSWSVATSVFQVIYPWLTVAAGIAQVQTIAPTKRLLPGTVEGALDLTEDVLDLVSDREGLFTVQDVYDEVIDLVIQGDLGGEEWDNEIAQP